MSGDYASDSEAFDLFGLPRELRDAIYDAMLDVSIRELDFGTSAGVRLAVKYAMIVQLALVGRQFSSECRERYRGICVVLKDTKSWFGDTRRLTLPFILTVPSAVAGLEMRMNIQAGSDHNSTCDSLNCWIPGEFKLHRETAEAILARHDSIRSLAMYLYISDSDRQAQDLRCALINQDMFKNLRCLTSLAFRRQTVVESNNWEFPASSEVLASCEVKL
ncbi:hypothetical protein LTR97_006718 [Elasticomyces elasticus]|uniref:Uncharacterized protein n=1 Tax=Elasticomyces elasticus TaxID=574655 RepID=A0AAN7ZNB4_9PEZI|nr:hypothetical protein LTR97_006718 [Elasticomyces elasticus]